MNAMDERGRYAGPPRSLTRITLRLVPLTPLHIGDGTEMRLDEYLIDGNMLCRFDQTAAMQAMSSANRMKFRTALDGGRLGEATELLRQAGRGAILERIAISPQSREELQKAFRDPRRRSGKVHPFIRSAGRPYIPGSSIKGAFRTALASAALPRDSRRPDSWTHADAMAAAFGLDRHDTATDPLRFLHVADAALPEGSTLVDRCFLLKRGAAAPEAMQMHYERTRALTDGRDAPSFTVSIHLDERAQREHNDCVRRAAACFNATSLLNHCWIFHWKLFKTECDRFFKGGGQGNKPLKDMLNELICTHFGPGDRPPSTQQGRASDFILLRLGRFGHFESKSLEGVRRGHFPQAKPPKSKIRDPDKWGNTRTVTRDAKGNLIPFGWVIGWLKKEETA